MVLSHKILLDVDRVVIVYYIKFGRREVRNDDRVDDTIIVIIVVMTKMMMMIK